MTQQDCPDSAAALPAILPVFPLEGVLLLPGGQLPLNIFEPRYLAMVEDALKADRMIGMIQPRNRAPEASGKGGDGALFETGCAGRITSFNETDDGRYLIGLTGISRFNITRELDMKHGYRRIAPDWTAYQADRNPAGCLDLDRQKLKIMLKDYFALQGIDCDWDAVDGASDQKLITCLSMICPFESSEKQALLEAACCRSRAVLFMGMLEMAICAGDGHGGGCH